MFFRALLLPHQNEYKAVFRVASIVYTGKATYVRLPIS